MTSMELSDTEASHRVGRPRSEVCDRAILAAAVEALLEDGYAGMSIEGVAARAGVGKATIYRRWPSKAELAVEAMRTRACASVPMVDTGDLRFDLVELLRHLLEAMRGVDGTLLSTVMAERVRHPELAEQLDRSLISERRAFVRRLVEQGRERGDLPPDTDVELVADVGFAVLWHRLSMAQAPLTDDLPERIVAQFLPPVATGVEPGAGSTP
jgi:AcrR family transcriptional regulator